MYQQAQASGALYQVSTLCSCKRLDIEIGYRDIFKPRLSNHRLFNTAIAKKYIHTILHSFRQLWRPYFKISSILKCAIHLLCL
mmetsp:Transcript_11438/g.70264  ORF Transcript_11438/g.70264 Transcript_11438/m.70264 type:complete len:83 (+) Transcript_11438:471-719(+)